MENELSEKRYKLRFSVERSIRYHARMVGKYEIIQKTLMFATILMGSASFAALNDSPELWGGIAATIAAFVLVYAPANKTTLHISLRNKFSDLAIDMESECTKENMEKWETARLRIEQNEPPVFWAVNTDCHNEVCRAWDRLEHVTQIGLWKRMTMYYMRHDRADV